MLTIEVELSALEGFPVFAARIVADILFDGLAFTKKPTNQKDKSALLVPIYREPELPAQNTVYIIV